MSSTLCDCGCELLEDDEFCPICNKINPFFLNDIIVEDDIAEELFDDLEDQ